MTPYFHRDTSGIIGLVFASGSAWHLRTIDRVFRGLVNMAPSVFGGYPSHFRGILTVFLAFWSRARSRPAYRLRTLARGMRAKYMCYQAWTGTEGNRVCLSLVDGLHWFPTLPYVAFLPQLCRSPRRLVQRSPLGTGLDLRLDTPQHARRTGYAPLSMFALPSLLPQCKLPGVSCCWLDRPPGAYSLCYVHVMTH